MAAYTVIPDTVLEPLKPIRSVDGLALRDNPIAIAEGAAGAPRVLNAALDQHPWGAEDFQTGTAERDWVLARTAGAAQGVVGSYSFLTKVSGGFVSGGDTAPGSELRYSDTSLGAGTGVSGTWRNMGATIPADGTEATVFLRIS